MRETEGKVIVSVTESERVSDSDAERKREIQRGRDIEREGGEGKKTMKFHTM